MNKILCIRQNESVFQNVEFSMLQCGDIFFAAGSAHRVSEKPHLCGDASYDGFLLYDEDGNSWFPEDLATKDALRHLTLNKQSNIMMF